VPSLEVCQWASLVELRPPAINTPLDSIRAMVNGTHDSLRQPNSSPVTHLSRSHNRSSIETWTLGDGRQTAIANGGLKNQTLNIRPPATPRRLTSQHTAALCQHMHARTLTTRILQRTATGSANQQGSTGDTRDSVAQAHQRRASQVGTSSTLLRHAQTGVSQHTDS